MRGGTETIVFTDIEGSTALLDRIGVGAYGAVMERQRAILRQAFGADPHGTEGDGCLFVLDSASAAVSGALAAQRALASERWPEVGSVKVRIGIHTGEIHRTGNGDIVGLAVHHAARIAAAAHGGQVVVSPATAVLAGSALPRGAALEPLGLHRLKDIAEPLALYQLSHPDLSGSFPPLRSQARPGGRLPVPLSPLVGRTAELTAVDAALEAGVRLVTLVGPGGAGKTRLATEVALRTENRFAGGAWFVRLSDVRDPATMWQVLATALGVSETAADLPTAVGDHLGHGDVLVVFDNLEQLDGAAGVVDRLVTTTAATVVATSRNPLHLPYETQIAIGELDEIVELFDQRARAVVPGWSLDGCRADVEEVCGRLDRLPLAVELVVPRLRTDTAAEIAAALREAVVAPLAVGSSRDNRPEDRHRNLRAVTDWSVSRLEPGPARTFTALAVFAGGFTRDAVAAVAGEEAATAHLDSLVESSLVAARPAPDGRMRFRLLDTIRAVAAERLSADFERAAIVERHRSWILAIALARPDFTDLDKHRTWLELLDDEQGNVAAALDADGISPDDRAELALALAPWWFERGYLTDGRRRLADALAAVRDDHPLAPDLHRWLGRLHLAASATEEATYAFLAALGGGSALSDRAGTFRDLLVALADGRHRKLFAADVRKAAAHAALTDALRRADEAGDDVAAAMSYTFEIQAAAGDGPPALKTRIRHLKRALRRFDVADHLHRALGEVRPPITTVAFTFRGRRAAAAIASAAAAAGHRTMLAQVLALADPAGASGAIDQLLSLGQGSQSLGRLAGDQALASVAQGALARGDLRRARDLAELAVERSAGDTKALHRALIARVDISLATGDIDQAVADRRRAEPLLEATLAKEARGYRIGAAVRHLVRGTTSDAPRWRLHLVTTAALIGGSAALVAVADWLAILAAVVAGIRSVAMLRFMGFVVMGPRHGESGGVFLIFAVLAAAAHAPWLTCVLGFATQAALAPGPAVLALAATPVIGAFLPAQAGAAFIPFAIVPWLSVAVGSRGHSWPGWLVGRAATAAATRAGGMAIGFGALAVLPGPFYDRYLLVAVGTASAALAVIGVELFRRRRDLRVAATFFVLAGGAGTVGAVTASVAVSLAGAAAVALAFLAVAARPTGFWPSIPRLEVDTPSPDPQPNR